MTRLETVAGALLGAGFTVAVCLALGTLLISRLRLEFHRLEFALFAFLSGSACLSLAIFFLCLVHQARLPVFTVGGLAAIALAVRQARRDPPRPKLPPLNGAWRVIFLVVFTVFFVCYFSNALAPEISPDGSGYHLGNVSRYWRNAGFDWSFHSIYSSLPQGMEMLFLMAFSIGRHSGAALVHMAFQTALPVLILCYGRRFGMPRSAAFAGLVTYASPVVGIAGISAYNDLAVATLLFAGFYLLQVNYDKYAFKYLLLIGLLAGFAYSVKPTAGVALLLALILTKVRRPVPLLVGAACTAGPWLLRNWFWTGNPLAPFFNHWFPNRFWSVALEQQYLAGLHTYPYFKSYRDFYMQITMLGGLVPSMLGPAFGLIPLALLSLRCVQGRRLWLAAVICAIPAWFNVEARFLIPALPFLALALGLALENSWGALPAVALMQSILCWPAVMTTYCNPLAWRVRGFQFPAALGMESEAAYVGSHVGDYALVPAIDSAIPSGARIFSFAGRAASYIDRDVVVGYESTEGHALETALEEAAARRAGEREAIAQAKTAGVGFLLVNDGDGVAQSMQNYSKDWGITEVAKANGTTLYRLD